MKATTLSSPAHTTLLRFVAHNVENPADMFEIIRTSWNGGSPITGTDEFMTAADAANYRARLIHQGWSESHGDCGR